MAAISFFLLIKNFSDTIGKEKLIKIKKREQNEDLFIAYRTFDSIALRSNGVAYRVAIGSDNNKKRGDR